MTLKSLDWAQWYTETDAGVRHLERAYSPSRFLEALRAHLPTTPASRVLELGCAPGRWLEWVRQATGARAVGVELEDAGVRLTHELYPTLALVRADAFHIPFADATFDAVYSIGLIEHFDDPHDLVKEARRVLRPGGVSLWLIPNIAAGSLCRWHWRTFRRENFDAHKAYTLEEFAAAIAAGGLVVAHREYSGLYVPHLQRVLGRLPVRGLLKGLEHSSLASNLVVVAHRERER